MPLTVSGAVVISEAGRNVKENLKGEIMKVGGAEINLGKLEKRA
jgi:hypothetical protein